MYFPFEFEDTQNLVIFNVKVVFGERELLAEKKWQTDNILRPPRRKYLTKSYANTCLSVIVQCMFGRNFTQFENSTAKRRHFVSAVSPVLVF